ncbi:disulfide bond formation protein B [Pseudomonas cremoricolorata]|uniref:Disulfide bond formation protein B n=1 Tax=Pseudomonas cremoricolorata TaxID=157783 RepID=A0A089WI87_9PSED|nr:disulfide bond formation protein B [Pseudomonas cremoricolorata]AIR89015.1 acetyltransferase [Pseudomonas cremoricolorata]
MSLARLRTLFFPASLASLIVLVGSIKLESMVGLTPCALCYSQRALLGVYLLLGICAVIYSPSLRSDRNYARTLLLSAGLGAWLAGRQVWLQSESWSALSCPSPVPTLSELPLGQALYRLLLGAPECAPINWSFLDLTLPEWSLLAFLVLACLPLSFLLAQRLRMLMRD